MRQEFHNHHEHCGAREEEDQMSGMQGNQRRPAIRVVLREDVSKELNFLTVRGDRPSVPLAAGKLWFAVVPARSPEKRICPVSGFVSNRGTRTFWMTPKLSSIVILNLIAKVTLLYHKSKNTRVLH